MLHRTVTLPVTWMTPNSQTTPICTFCVVLHIFIVSNIDTSNLVCGYGYSKSQPIDDKVFLKTTLFTSRDPFEIFSPPEISLERLELDTSDFVHWLAT